MYMLSTYTVLVIVFVPRHCVMYTIKEIHVSSHICEYGFVVIIKTYVSLKEHGGGVVGGVGTGDGGCGDDESGEGVCVMLVVLVDCCVR